MMSGRFGASREDVLRLFEGDSVAGLGVGELLERFAARRDEAAFEALTNRLGPMVLGTCRRMLNDPHDVDDAFQATFLVLVRKASSIRNPDLVAPWLHGVATRIARRARAESARRTARERVAVVVEAREEGSEIESEWPELRALIDEEIERLPENHRRAVVLCDVEGLSREEAALRLGWSLNMVRGRLERARDRLRGRLARRGLAPSGAWATLVAAPPTPAPALLAATTRAALAFSVGRTGAGLASASAVALSQGVLRMMMLSKLKIGLAILLSSGLVAGSGMLAAQGLGNKPASADVDGDGKPDVIVAPQKENAVAEGNLATLGKRRIEMARKRLDTQKAFYEEGRITIDRLLNASQTLLDAELDVTDAQEARISLIKAHLDRIKDIEKRELAELEVGRATLGDVAEVQTHRLEVEFRLAKEAESADRKPSKPTVSPKAEVKRNIDQERVEIARRIHRDAQRLFSAGEISSTEFLEASRSLLEAERGAARTKAERVAAVQGQVDILKKMVAAKEDQAKKGEASRLEVDRAQLQLLDAESLLIEESGKPEGPGEGALPTPGGPFPGPNPGASKATEGRERSLLASAIEVFNKEAANDEFGRDREPLTEDEVIAAVRAWKPEQGQAVSKELAAILDSISEAKRWPEGVDLSSLTQKYNGKDFFFYGWWVVLRAPGMDVTRGIMIRQQLVRSVTYEEALAKAEVELNNPSSTADRSRLEKRIEGLKQKILERKFKTYNQEIQSGTR